MGTYNGTNGAQGRNMDAPWFWLNKAAVQLIRDAYGHTGVYDRVFKVYVALAELSSDKGNKQTFSAGRALIAHKACVSTSTVDRALKCLAKIKLVAIKRRRVKGRKEQLENEYTLLEVAKRDVEKGDQDVAKLNEVSSRVMIPYRHSCDDTPIVTGDAVVEERKEIKEMVHVAGDAPDVVNDESVDSKTEEEERVCDAPAAASNERTTSAARCRREVDLSGYDNDERCIIDELWHNKVCAADPRCLPVTKYSQQVSDALAVHDYESFADLCEGALNGEASWGGRKNKTLVGLVWSNY
jgi:hypothetical protein